VEGLGLLGCWRLERRREQEAGLLSATLADPALPGIDTLFGTHTCVLAMVHTVSAA
jgi:hypothetical protein